MKLFYLFTVGFLNLGLGIGLAQWLTRRAFQDTSAAPEAIESDEPRGEASGDATSPAAEVSDAQNAAVIEQSSSETAGQRSEAGVASAEPTASASVASEQRLGHQQQLDEEQEMPVAETDTADELAAQQLPAPVPFSVEPDLDILIAELDRCSDDFGQRFESLNAESKPADELELANGEINGAAQQLLQLVNTAVDALSKDDSVADNDQTIERLEDCWSDINDEAVQLVTVTFDKEDTTATQVTLAKACQGLSDVCQKALDRMRPLA